MTGRWEVETDAGADHARQQAEAADGPDVMDGSPPPVAVHPPILFPAVLSVALVLDRLAPLVTAPWPALLRFGLGGLLVAFAMLLAGWAAWAFYRAGTAIPTFRPARRFVSSGPYAFTRNPMYLGLVLLLAGLGLMLASGWTLLFVPVFVALMDRLVIAREEPYLAARFGDPYRAYLRRVRRWI